jgi:hypothetical protein
MEEYDQTVTVLTGQPSATAALQAARDHFAKARRRLAQGEDPWHVVLDELEAAVMPILQQLEARLSVLERTVGKQQDKIESQQVKIESQQDKIESLEQWKAGAVDKIESLEQWKADTEAMLDVRQCCIFLRNEFVREFCAPLSFWLSLAVTPLSAGEHQVPRSERHSTRRTGEDATCHLWHH